MQEFSALIYLNVTLFNFMAFVFMSYFKKLWPFRLFIPIFLLLISLAYQFGINSYVAQLVWWSLMVIIYSLFFFSLMEMPLLPHNTFLYILAYSSVFIQVNNSSSSSLALSLFFHSKTSCFYMRIEWHIFWEKEESAWTFYYMVKSIQS